MCGISLIVNKENLPVSPDLIEAMNTKIIHRGPDHGGYYLGKNFALGHRRLSIIDISEHAFQPMHYMDKYVLIYNGEIYNYIEIREELIAAGYKFISTSDTEVILASYDKWGEDCVSRFNGMWAFVLHDKAANTLFCSRDRFGIKPFNYTSLPDKFLIASEIKQFTVFPDFMPRLNYEETWNYLVNSHLNTGKNTLFENVNVLSPGCNLSYDLTKNSYSIKQYYSIENTKKLKPASFKESAQQFKSLFNTAIKIRLRSDVEVGACLSGGIDSSSIVSTLKEQKVENLRAISVCFAEDELNEKAYMDIILKKTGYTQIEIWPDMSELITLDLLSKIVYHQDQPILSGSHFAEFKLFEAAHKNNIKVMLDGQGADEFIAGYINLFYKRFSELLRKSQFLKLLREISAYTKKHNKSLFKTLLSTFYIVLFSKKNNNKQFIGKEFYKKYYKQEKETTSVNEESLEQILRTSIPYQLHSEDRNSMMNSTESRLPFFDFDLIDFIYSLPDDFKIRNGETKAILREAMKNTLPQEILNRHDKIGFAAPDETFIRKYSKTIREHIAETITTTKGIISPDLLGYYDQFVKKEKNYDPIIFRVFIFNIWLKTFNIQL
jgi:asparagine synthase (glutamine-hydrolysing)